MNYPTCGVAGTRIVVKLKQASFWSDLSQARVIVQSSVACAREEEAGMYIMRVKTRYKTIFFLRHHFYVEQFSTSIQFCRVISRNSRMAR